MESYAQICKYSVSVEKLERQKEKAYLTIHRLTLRP